MENLVAIDPRSAPAATGAPAAADPAAEARLRAAAKRFESLFVSILLSSMRSTVPESGLLDQGSDARIYRQMHDQALAESVGDRCGLGIADLLVARLRAVGSAAANADPGGASRSAAPTAAPGTAAAPRAAADRDGSTADGPMPAAPVPPPALASPGAPAAAASATAPATAAAAAVAGYRRQAALGEKVAAMTRLRRLAEREGGAVADSLRQWQGDLGRAAEETGVDPALLLAVMVHESGGDPAARSPRGALGLMQLMPGTAREVGVEQPLEPAQNLLGGARYLARMLRGHGEQVDLALAAYNAGPGTVAAHGGRVPPYRETRRYVTGVMDLYRRLGGRPEAAAPEPRTTTAGTETGSVPAQGGA